MTTYGGSRGGGAVARALGAGGGAVAGRAFSPLVHGSDRRINRVITRIATILAVLTAAAPAAGMTPTITAYHTGINGQPVWIAPGPDGNLWFTEQNPPAIGRITSDGLITELTKGLNSGSKPAGIVAGRDGELWFTDAGSTAAIGSTSPAGSISELRGGPPPVPTSPAGIAVGGDGNIWFADYGEPSGIGRLDPCTPFPCPPTIREFTNGLHTDSRPNAIATAPDGSLWFTDLGNNGFRAIGHAVPCSPLPCTPTITEYTSGIPSGANLEGIAAAPDGNVWFGQASPAAIGRITPDGVITEFAAGLNAGSAPAAIALGPDGSMWFTDLGAGNKAIGRITPDGAIVEFSDGLSPNGFPVAIALGADGNMWFTDAFGSINRVTTPPNARTSGAFATGPTTATVSGVVSGHAQPTTARVEYGPVGGDPTLSAAAQSVDGAGEAQVTATLSGLRPGTTYTARVVATNPTDTVRGAFLEFTTSAVAPAEGGAPPRPRRPLPRLVDYRITPADLVAAGHGPPIAAPSRRTRHGHATGALVTYTDTRPATTTFTIVRLVPGRRQGAHCTNRNRPPCAHAIDLGSFIHRDRAGHDRFRFTGRIKGRKLGPGSYRLQAVPSNAAGRGPQVSRSFRVLRNAR